MPELRKLTPARKLTFDEDKKRVELVMKIYNRFSTREIEKVLNNLYINRQIENSVVTQPVVDVIETSNNEVKRGRKAKQS